MTIAYFGNLPLRPIPACLFTIALASLLVRAVTVMGYRSMP